MHLIFSKKVFTKKDFTSDLISEVAAPSAGRSTSHADSEIV